MCKHDLSHSTTVMYDISINLTFVIDFTFKQFTPYVFRVYCAKLAVSSDVVVL